MDGKSKIIPKTFLEIERKRTLIAAGEWRKRNCNKNWEEIRTQVLKHLQGAKKSDKKGSEGDVRRRAAA